MAGLNNADGYKTQAHGSSIFSPFLLLNEINFQGLICFPLFHSNITDPGPTSSSGCGTSQCERRTVGDENGLYAL